MKTDIFDCDAQVILFLLGPHWIKVPPLDLVYLENFLAQNGFNVKVIDLNIIFYNLLKVSKKDWLTLNPEFENNLYLQMKKSFPDLINELISKVSTSKAKILSFSLFSRNRKATIDFVNDISKANQDKTFVFGGPEVLFEYHRDLFFDEINSNNFYFVLGEGELPLLNICENIYNSKHIDYTLHKGKKIIKYNEIKNLDSLPFLNFENLDLEFYNTQTLPLFSSRGCIKRCTFCSECKLFKNFRQHSPEYMLELIKFLINKHGISTFSFHDSLINANLDWLDKFCSFLIKENLKINPFDAPRALARGLLRVDTERRFKPRLVKARFGAVECIKWEAQFIVRKDLTEDLLKKIKTSGCYNLFVGLESGSDKILKLMNKGYDTQQAKDFFKKLSAAGLQFEVSLIVGFPQEDENDFKQTLEFIKQNKKYIPKIAQVNPFVEYAPSEINKQNPELERITRNRMSRLLEMFEEEKIRYTASFVNNLTQNS